MIDSKNFNEIELKNKILSNEQIQNLNHQIDNMSGANFDIKNQIKFIINDYNQILIAYLNLIQATFSQDYSKKINFDVPRSDEYFMENFNEDKNIIKMKITNEILKKIENTVNYQNYFANKYSNDNNYQTFLNNLIEYRFSLKDLNNIKTDITKFEKYNPYKKKYKKYPKEEEPNNFSKSLRKYSTDYNDLDLIDKKPFINYTSPYGDYFDKNVKKISANVKHSMDFY